MTTTRELPKRYDDLVSLAYAVALNLGGITGEVAARNINTMSRADLEKFVTDHRHVLPS